MATDPSDVSAESVEEGPADSSGDDGGDDGSDEGALGDGPTLEEAIVPTDGGTPALQDAEDEDEGLHDAAHGEDPAPDAGSDTSEREQDADGAETVEPKTDGPSAADSAPPPDRAEDRGAADGDAARLDATIDTGKGDGAPAPLDATDVAEREAAAGDATLHDAARESGGAPGPTDTKAEDRRTTIPAVWLAYDTGQYHSLGVLSDGTLWAWGENDHGQLGTGDTTDARAPVAIGTDSDWRSVTAGSYQSYAIKADGTLWAWGQNGTYGLLGTGDSTDQLAPVQVGTDNDWASVAMYDSHCLALKTDGTLWAWGWNGAGNLGVGDFATRMRPVQVGDGRWRTVATAFNHSLGIKIDGTLWAWGNHTYGQLGLGDAADGGDPITNASRPVQVGRDNRWTAVAGGTWHSVAIKSDGSLWAWGWNESGNLGLGDYVRRYSPERVGSDNDWVSVSTACEHSFAVKSTHTLWGWGENLYVSPPQNTSRPMQIGQDTDWTSVSDGCGHQLATKPGLRLWAMGSNGSGQLGLGDSQARSIHAELTSVVVQEP